MAFLSFSCEHCGKKSHRFLRPSEVRKPVICPACKKTVYSGGSPVSVSAPAVTGGKKITCTICD
jgi:hypothetical protein